MKRTGLMVALLSLLVIVSVALASCGATVTTQATTATTAPATTSSTSGSTDTTAAPPADAVKIKVVSFVAQNNTMNDGLKMLIDKVKEKTNGAVVIEWGGGPESIPAQQLAEAVRTGITDMAWIPHTYSVSQIPVLEGAKLSTIMPWEEREKGVTEFYAKLYREKMNVQLLGSGTPGLTYNLYTTFPVSTVADFKGKTIRGTPAYKTFVEALGAAVVTTDAGEVYTALERNLVAGYGWPSVGISDFGWQEVTKYVVEPAFYQVDVCGLMAAAVWDKLSPELQGQIVEAMEEVEREAYDHYQKLIKEDREKIVAAGVQVSELSGEEATKYLETAYNSNWDSLLKAVPTEAGELKQLLGQ